MLRRTLLLLLGAALVWARAGSAQSRIWRSDERIHITSFNNIQAMAYDGRRVFAASDNGLEIYDEIARAWLPPSTVIDGYPLLARASAALYDRTRGGLWLETAAGMFFRSDLTERWEPRPFDRPDTTIIRMCTQGSRDDAAWRVLRASLGLDPFGQRWPVSASVPGQRDGTYWVGTAGGNILFADARNLSSEWLMFGTLSRGIGALAVDARGGIWLGGDGYGPRDGISFAQADLQKWQWYEPYSARAPRGDVTRIIVEGDTAWAAATDGLYLLPRAARSWQRIGEREGLLSEQVRALAVTSAGIWAATTHGLALIDRAAARVAATTLPAARIYALAARGDSVWLAGDVGFAVATFEGGSITVAPLVSRAALSVATAGNAVFFLAADGLYRWDGALGARLADAAVANIGRPYALRADEHFLYLLGERGLARMAVADNQWSYLVAPGDVPDGPVRDVARAGNDTWIATPAGATRIRWP